MPIPRILIVDDYPNLVRVLTMRLQSEGYEVLSSADGLDGLFKARTESPDLILLDVLLPKMDGFKICRLLKSDEKRRHIPIIMLTSRARDIDRHTGMEMGADAYMHKPYDPPELLDKIGSLIAGKRPAGRPVASMYPPMAQVV